MKVYLVQPMRGMSKEDILRVREMGIRVVKSIYPDAEILENYFEDYDPSLPPVHYLAKSCELLAQADLMVMLPFYLGTPGCDVESHIGEAYKIPRLVINFIPNPDGTYGQVEGGLF